MISSRSLKFSTSVVGLAAFAVFAVSSNTSGAETRSSAAATYDAGKSVTIKSENRSFININPAIQFAPAHGMFSETPHGTFGKFPANFETPVHIHTGAYHGVVIAGTMTNPFEGEKKAPHLQPGSYWYVPAGMEHTTACVSDTPCEFYFHADSSFDFTPVE